MGMGTGMGMGKEIGKKKGMGKGKGSTLLPAVHRLPAVLPARRLIQLS